MPAGQPTLTSGAELDYVLASNVLVPFLELKVVWDVPWKPHGGILLTVNKAAPRLVLPQLTHYVPVPKLDDAARSWDDVKAVPKVFWLGRSYGPKEQQCAEWCHQAENYVLQNLNEPKKGRGSYLALEMKPLPVTKAITPWKKGDLAYWGQFQSILAHVASRGKLTPQAQVHLKAKAADLDRRWQEVHGKEDFVAALETLLDGQGLPMTLLIQGADANQDFAKKVALGHQSTLKGHSGIYRSLKAPD